MRIIDCHIENFGKLSDKSYSFDAGLNVIHEPNGTGKSTLASFIKVMFFGFAGEGKRNDLENERKRYKPWQGGVYGGQLTFWHDKKAYKLVRTFGTKENDDTFALYDVKTNLESSDFSSRIGEELLMIDEASFCRTVYIAAGDCVTENTDRISAKLGNLADNTDDINNYETVSKKLGDTINAMSPKRKTGSIYKKKERLGALKESVRKGDAVDSAIAGLTIKRDEAKEERDRLKERQAAIQEQINKALAKADVINRKKTYDDIVKRLNSAKEKYDESRSVFKNGIPDEALLSENISKCVRLEGLKNNLKSADIEKKNEFPNENEIDEYISLAGHMSERKNLLGAKKASMSALELAAEKNSNPVGSVIIAASVMAIIAGIILLFAKMSTLGAAFIIAGVVILVSGFIIIARTASDKTENTALTNLRLEIANDEEYIKNAAKRLSDFAAKYQITAGEGITSDLYRLKSDAGNFKRYEGDKAEYDKLFAEISLYITKLGFEVHEDMHATLLNIKDRLKELYDTGRWCESIEKEKNLFEANNNIQQFVDIINDGNNSLDKYNSELKDIAKKLENVIESISHYNRQIDNAMEARELIAEDEEKLAKLSDEIAADEKSLDIITKTKQYLDVAKQNFTARYMEPIMHGFERYYRLLAGESASGYQINADIEVAHEELGNYRDTKLLSSGFQSLIGICMRMALVDAMYEQEKPFVVFDDPFVYLDDDKRDRAKEFLADISETYQVIYFTCHK